MSDLIERKLRKLIADELDIAPEKITKESSFMDDLGADSFDMVDIALIIEEAFGICVPDSVIESMKTINDAIEYIKGAMLAKG